MTYDPRFDQLCNDVASLRTDLAVIKTRLGFIREEMPTHRSEIRAIGRRVGSLEAWRWKMIGAAAAAGLFGGPLWDAFNLGAS